MHNDYVFLNNKVYANNTDVMVEKNINKIDNLSLDDSIIELNKLLLYYQNESLVAKENEKEKITSKIQKLQELILLFKNETVSENTINRNLKELDYDNPKSYFGISPNCTCDRLNYLTNTPCYNCELYYNTLMGVTIIISGFSMRGWKLAADLMLHNLNNDVLDSDYTPMSSLVERVKQCTQILDEVALSDKLTSGFDQKTPGRLNGLFADTIEGDVYNALGKFYYAKSYAGNDNVNISILDRYDWDRNSDSPGGVLIDVLVQAQELKIVTPFYTKIDITVTGKAPLIWNYDGTFINIIGSSKKYDHIVIPNSFLDLRARNIDLPSIKQIIIDKETFKNDIRLKSIIIPNNVTNIDTSAFENCYSLQGITLPNNMTSIGNSVFKGCASLESISIPNSVTHIDTSAFEGCSYLQSVTLSTNLIAIGSSAFKGCGSLERIVIPSSVQYIDAEAFKNCSSLSSVTVNRRITSTTNLGENAFDGCNNNLKIIVPTNRVAEYKNKEYWSSYRNKIMPFKDYIKFEIDCEGNITDSLNLSKATNELYKLNVKCSKSYKINTNSSNIVNIIIYDSNMNVVSSDSNTITQFLGCGTYYISFEFDDTNASGTFEFEISLTWKSTDILVTNGVNNIKNSMHLNSEGVYHCKYLYISNSKDGLYKFSLKALNNTSYPEGAIKIYKDQNRKEILDRYLTAQINKQAISERNENEIYVYISYNECFYIDITLSNRSYTSITLSIEEPETCEFDYQDRLTSISFDSLFDNKSCSAYFEEVTISHPSKIELDIMTSGTINKNIPIYIFEKHRDPGYEPGINHYYIILKYTDDIISTNRSPVFTIVLEAGTYYIGYANNTDNIEINFALRRKVNTNLNIDGTLVTDPARDQGFPLGSEVIFNEGILSGNTITEGFTRNLYLMVEDRLREPMSRLEYYWYSTNENVAKVTKYGTVLALNVDVDTSVTIYAINIKDPSIIYKKNLTILKETKTKQITIKSNMSYSYSKENGMYTLELDFTNSPYPYIGYYVWDIECFDGININMEHHGLIESTGPGAAILTANYILNRRIFLEINLTITE